MRKRDFLRAILVRIEDFNALALFYYAFAILVSLRDFTAQGWFFFRAILVRIQDFSAHSRFKCDCAIFVRKHDFLHMRDFSALTWFLVRLRDFV